MKGLTVTILLAILEITAISVSSGGSLLTDAPPASANRRQEAGVQAEVLVDAERPEFADGHQLRSSKNQKGRPA